MFFFKDFNLRLTTVYYVRIDIFKKFEYFILIYLKKHFIVISACKNVLYRNCIHNRLREDELSASKQVEDTRKLKI